MEVTDAYMNISSLAITICDIGTKSQSIGTKLQSIGTKLQSMATDKNKHFSKTQTMIGQLKKRLTCSLWQMVGVSQAKTGW